MLLKTNIFITNIIILFLTYIVKAMKITFSNDASKQLPKENKQLVERLLNSKMKQYGEISNKRGKRNKRNDRSECGSVKYSTVLVYPIIASEAKTDKRSNYTRFDTDSAPVGIDNRCTGCISHVAQDFIGPLRDTAKSIKGFGGHRTHNVKMGTLSWKWLDDNGKESKFQIPNSYFVPSGKVRLLSPQHWAKTQIKSGKSSHNGTISQTTAEDITLMWNDRKNKLSVPLSKESNVATFQLAPGYTKYDEFCCMLANDNLECDDRAIISMEAPMTKEELNTSIKGKWATQDGNQSIWQKGRPIEIDWDITEQKVQQYNDENPESKISWSGTQDEIPDTPNELLKIHYRFGHISFAKLQIMAKKGIIPRKYATCEIPICQACAYAKMVRRPWRNKPIRQNENNEITLKPGEVISVDQLVSPVPGFIAQMTGKLTVKRYKHATVFVDQASKLGYAYLQKSADADETVEAKKAFESYMQSLGLTVKAYHADNGIFRAHKWVNACNENKQQLTFAGVNAHHQNGVAERRIRELQELARTMMIHASRRWKNTLSTTLWPYALRIANNVYNNTPLQSHKDQITPIQAASGATVEINKKHYKPFGCPVYVLNRQLQLGNPHGKWNERSKMGIYLGQSPVHNKNVALVMDVDTGLVSPQFHVMFDNEFRTVRGEITTPTWKIKAGLLSEREVEISQRKRDKIPIIIPGLEANSKDKMQKRILGNDVKKNMQQNSPKRHKTMTESNKMRQGQMDIKLSPDIKSNLRRSPRLNPHLKAVNELLSLQTLIAQHDTGQIKGEIFNIESLTSETAKDEMEHPLACKASTDPDTMYMHQAMKQPDKAEFVQAMEKEVLDQMNNNNFTIVHKNSVPKDKVILPAVWQMKRKRDIRTQEVKKYKARLNIDGSRMIKGIHYDKTYAPVASWNSIRIMLAMVAAYEWHTQQIDYVLAFPQAPVEKEIYMKVPRGFKITGKNPENYVLKLNQNVYGQKQAGRVWNKYLEKILIDQVGFTQSKIDNCVYYKGKTMYVLYTDDSILAGPDKEEIESIINKIRGTGLNITREGDIKDFLGINITKRDDGSIELKQPHLIDQILNDLKMDKDNLKMKETPCKVSQVLHSGTEYPPFDNSFHYRSIIGKLNYLEKGTRSDISYITHQCARFTSNPKENHARAIRWIARYLKSTRDKGFIMIPNKNKGLEVYVDADFSGNWHKEDAIDKATARSRHGYIIKYMNCPIVWKSQLQHEIALSSTESEYTGLSYALREVIPIMNLLREMADLKYISNYTPPKVACTVFEDNSGALQMANIHKYRPRTKHLNVKLHHFRQYVEEGLIKIVPIASKNQQADYLTKPVKVETLTRLRKLVMGW